MSANAFTGHALCQSLYLEGITGRAEANIESLLRKLWGNNGPDFVIDYLKVIKSETEHSLVDPNYKYHHQNGEVSVAWNHKLNRPKGPLGTVYRQFPNPIKRVRVIGAMIQSITYEEATPKQVTKFVQNVRSDSRSNEAIRLSGNTLRRLERNLAKRVKEIKEPFGYTDLTNNVLPYAHVAKATAGNKEVLHKATLDSNLRTTPEVHRAVGELHADKLGQFYTAPRICKGFWNKILDLAYGPYKSLEPKPVRYPGRISPRPFVARDYEYNRVYGRLADDTMEYSAPGAADYLGRLDFLQKPGGKLRTVANVNRYVNWTMDPFAKALQDTFYGARQIAVLDQKSGMRWVQQKLRSNTRLTSFDLTAATDLLDYRVLTRAFQKDFEGASGLLKTYATYFEKLSSLPLYCESLESAVQFRTGQPLGMKGSFQVLTIMNFCAGHLAEMRAHLDPNLDNFRVVGDDFVCDSRMAAAYDEIISSWGGKTNAEKAMESEEYAEFLSHIITGKNVYVTKPKYRPGTRSIFSNLEKAKTRDMLNADKARHIFRLSSQEKDAISLLSEYSVDEMDYRANLPRFHSKDLTKSDFDLEVMSAALDVIAELRSAEPCDFALSPLALDYVLLEDPTLVEYSEIPRQGKELYRGPEIHENIATMPTSRSVYDHRTGKSAPKQTRSQAARDFLRRVDDLKKLEKSYYGTGRSEAIDLGHGRRIQSDSIVLASIGAIDSQTGPTPNRREATTDESLPKRREKIKRTAIDLSIDLEYSDDSLDFDW